MEHFGLKNNCSIPVDVLGGFGSGLAAPARSAQEKNPAEQPL